MRSTIVEILVGEPKAVRFGRLASFVIAGLIANCSIAPASQIVSRPRPSPTPCPIVAKDWPTGAGCRPVYSEFLDTFIRARASFATAEANNEALQENLALAPYERQAYEDWFVLALVIILVIAGLGLTIVQFVKSQGYAESAKRIANRTAVRDGERDGAVVSAPDANSIIISLTNVEFKSASLGLAILIISLAFFYLYLAFVFPVKATESTTSGTSTNAAAHQ